jgi:uncharacterized protein DUF397
VEQFDRLIWVRAQYCNSGACVEVSRIDDGVLVRDSKNPQGPRLKFSNSEWEAFVEGVRNGDFDHQTSRHPG